MNDRNRENLAELIEKLYNGEHAGEVFEDVRDGERILRENPAPKPGTGLIADIKAEIATHLSAQQVQISKWRTYKRAAVAAAVIIIATIGTTLIEDNPQKTERTGQAAGIIPTAIWESDNIAFDDENLAVFNAQIEQIENEVMHLESPDDEGSSVESIEEMEIELIVVSNDFWKE